MPTETLESKLKRTFPEQIVDKKFMKMKDAGRLPRFIAEYVVKEICGENPTHGDFEKLAKFISKYYPEPKDKDKVLHDLMEKGEYTLIDEIKVTTDIKQGLHNAAIPSLNVYDAMIFNSILEKNEALLRSGMWGVSTLKYVPTIVQEGRSRSPILITKFVPLQVSDISLNEFKRGRREFITNEWIDALINTIGLNPSTYNDRTKMILLSRLIPLVEENVNVIELGPRATGKTYFYRNSSYYTRIYSGGNVSPSTLFYHGTFKVVGDIGLRDCVVFDEISKITFTNPDEMMGKLKDYMADGQFERGMLKRARSTCSLVFMGNVEVEDSFPAEDFSSVLPNCMVDSAFIDRLHGFIPGWELPKIMQSDVHLSDGYGFVTDYFCEILHQLRREDFQKYITDNVRLKDNLTIRDERGIKKIAAGMLKILCPHGEYGRDELTACMDLAIEYRQRIADWLSKLSPGEFKEKKLTYEISSV